MNITGADITGGKSSAKNPANEKTVPSGIERFINKLMEHPNPKSEPTHIGDKPPTNDAYLRGVIDRKSIVALALTLTDKVSEQILTRICDQMFNDGCSMETLHELSALEITETSVSEVMSVLEGAQLLEDGPPVALEKVEGVITIARAILKYIMTHHGENYNTGAFRYEQRHVCQDKTPFEAWRLKEHIQEWLIKSEPLIVNKEGYDTKRQCDEFFANFNVSEIVLWDYEIWQAAVRGYEKAFFNTPLSQDIVDSLIPMFWQFNRSITFAAPIGLPSSDHLAMNKKNYECVGISVMPHREHLVEVIIQDPDNSLEFTPDPGSKDAGVVKVNTSDQRVKDAILLANEKIDKGDVVFARYGISIGLVFMPLHDKLLPPEIRFLPALFEGDTIQGHLIAMVSAAAKFLTLKYVAKDSVSISKKELKQDRPLFKAVRKGKVQAPPIKIINLRRPERRERTEEEAKRDSKRNYTCWWMVDPHWRRQFFPSLNRHQRIRIFSYPKGDFTKPFKPSREKVFKAVR